MPAMPRPKGKARKIAYAVLGEPPNLRKRTYKKKKLNRELLVNEVAFAR